MNKRIVCMALLLLALAWAAGGCAWLQPTLTPPQTATPTWAVTVTNGLVRNAITKAAVGGARLQSGSVTALSDVEGAFSIPTLAEAEIEISAPGYETTRIHARAAYPLVVDLVPDAATTFQIIYNYEKQHEFGRQYDLLHPDVQALFSREEYIRFMEQNRPYDVVDFSVGAVNVLMSGTVGGRTYENVAQVQLLVTVRSDGQLTQRAWLGYAVKAAGRWRWFRGPLVWPTPVPTATSTPTPMPLPTVTLTPRPTRTPYPTAIPSPTAYTPILPGSQAVVIVDATGVRTGPGDNYPVVWGVTRGAVLLILEWPRWVNGLPWYHVQLAGAAFSGWCLGSHLAPLASAPTPTTLPPPTIAPSTLGSIAFTTDRDGNREVYVMNADGTDLRNLTRHPAQDGDASWSPAHDRLAFTSDRNGNNDIFVMNADGSGLVQLTFNAANQVHPAWAPNGAWIAYVSDEDGDWEIFITSVSGSGTVQLTHNTAWDSYPCWSPDSRKLAFTSERDGNLELYVYDLSSQTEARLTDNAVSDAFPAWSPTGNEIAFTSARDGQLELYLLNVLAVQPSILRLTYTLPASAANRYPAWSHDGNWLAFTSWRDGNAEIYVIQHNGLGLRNLTNNPAADESPTW